MGLLEVGAIAGGALASIWVLASAIRTVAIPRPEKVGITRLVFEIGRVLSQLIANLSSAPATRNRLLGMFAPIALLSLPVVWSVLLIASFAAIFWGLDVGSIVESLELSGSSLTTLGFVPAPTLATRLVAIFEGLLGLAIMALMISFLPTLYGTFSRREIAVGRLNTRAGSPPTSTSFLLRLNSIGRLAHVGERWSEWEDWFVELEETHTSFPALVYFRSARPDRSWLSAAETALDTASLVTAAQLAPRTGEADTMIRSGYLAVREIANFWGVAPELDPAQRLEIGVSRARFEEILDAIERGGLVSPVARDQIWDDFCGWRVNYDSAIRGLRAMVGEVPSQWTAGPNLVRGKSSD